MGRPMGALLTLAAARGGYFTTAQAAAVGVTRRMLSLYTELHYVERLRRGVYRLVAHPRHRHERIVVACLWAGPQAAASHESALVLHGVADDAEGPVHVTAEGFGGRRADTIVHQAALDATETTEIDGIPVTSVARTITDLAKALDPVVVTPLIETMLDREVVAEQQLRTLAMTSPAVSAAALRTILRLNRERGTATAATQRTAT